MKAHQRLAMFLAQTGMMGNSVTCTKVASRLAQLQRIRAICEDDTRLHTVPIPARKKEATSGK